MWGRMMGGWRQGDGGHLEKFVFHVFLHTYDYTLSAFICLHMFIIVYINVRHCECSVGVCVSEWMISLCVIEINKWCVYLWLFFWDALRETLQLQLQLQLLLHVISLFPHFFLFVQLSNCPTKGKKYSITLELCANDLILVRSSQ